MENGAELAEEIARLDSIIQDQVRVINDKLAVNYNLYDLEDDAARLNELLYLRKKKQDMVEQLGNKENLLKAANTQ